MALYVTRPRRDEERIGRGLPSENIYVIIKALALNFPKVTNKVNVFKKISRTPGSSSQNRNVGTHGKALPLEISM